jgi:hypothetical protein
MEGLEEWITTYTSGEEGVNELMFPRLKTLRITQCSKLKLNGNTQQLSRLESLSLSHCGSMTSIPRWLGELTSLKKFEICDCEAIRSLPDSIQKLSNLEYLHVDGCPNLVEWYESKENKMKLTHIRVVKVCACQSICCIAFILALLGTNYSFLNGKYTHAMSIFA